MDELDERGDLEGSGGAEPVNELAALVPASANARHYAQIVHESSILRGLIRAGGEISRLGWERPGDATMLVDQAEQIVFELGQERAASEFSHIEALLKESFERITALYELGAEITGVPSGFRDFDRLTSGFQEGNLIIVAARPGMGKSALALGMAANVAVRCQIPVALFTLEMSKAEVTQRLMCAEAKVELHRLRTGRLGGDDWPRLTAACDRLAKAPMYIDDTGSITMMEIRAKARRLKSKHPDLGLILVDYLQLMTSGTSAENRVQEVSQISRSLKMLARDLETPIIAMSQLSRAVEQRHDKRPILSDLRESGSIEQDADIVCLHLPRRLLQPGGLPGPGRRRGHPRQAPQRPDRQGEALLHLAVREVRGSGRGLAAPTARATKLQAMPATVIVGAQWGDEGKGKIVDLLAEHSDVVCRYQGGPNAGHTIVRDGETFKLHHIPSGILYAGRMCVVGAGCVLDPRLLVEEIDGLEARGITTGDLRISGNAHLIMPWHVAIDSASERRLGRLQIGTTRRGIGPAYADKAARIGIRMQDVLDPKILRQKFETTLAENNMRLAAAARRRAAARSRSSPTAWRSTRRGCARTSRTPRCSSTRALEDGKRVLLEGAQGTLLDLDHGTYPFVTSSSPTAGAAATGNRDRADAHRPRDRRRQGVPHARRRGAVPDRDRGARQREGARARRRVRHDHRAASAAAAGSTSSACASPSASTG